MVNGTEEHDDTTLPVNSRKKSVMERTFLFVGTHAVREMDHGGSPY